MSYLFLIQKVCLFDKQIFILCQVMKSKVLLFFILITNLLFSQVDSTLVSPVLDTAIVKKKKPTTHHFFFQPEGQFAFIFSKPSMIFGIGVNWLINGKIYIGARYNHVSTPVNIVKLLPLIDKSGNVGAKSQSSSIYIGYIAWSQKRFSFNPELSIGWADCRFFDPSVNQDKRFNYAIVIPSINGVWNAHKAVKVGVGINARAVFGENYYRVKSYRVGGVGAGVFLRVGKFW